MSMIVIIHVVIALTSIAVASYAYFSPDIKTLRSSYALIALTFISGFYLVWSMPGKLLQACLSGVAYLAVISAVTVLARQKLARRQAAEYIETN